jgi:hypothetical protein
MRWSILVPLLAACSTQQPSSDDVVGPFTGTVQRYSIDSFQLPMNNTDARAFGADLNGDGTIDNQLGMVFGSLSGQADLTKHSADMIQAGALDSWLEIQADDSMNDPTVGVRYVGAPGTPFTVMGGTLVDGAFTSNRTISSLVPGSAELDLPVFADADPIRIGAFAMQLSFTPDGHGGLDASVAGAIDAVTARKAMVDGMLTMIAANPRDHVYMLSLFDKNKDLQITSDEITTNPLITSLLAPDLDLFDGDTYSPGVVRNDGVKDGLSFGFKIHLVPCASGTCAASIDNTCFDRVRDGNETDVDCGGSCGKCAAEATCAIAGDCQSNACNAGTCAAPTCSDGVKDGFEANVDCGTGCGGCANGQACQFTSDCASGHCNNGYCSLYPQ